MKAQLLELQRQLGLAMGIHDCKEGADGEWYWLEVNPQGRFLFLEPLTSLGLAGRFADFLASA